MDVPAVASYCAEVPDVGFEEAQTVLAPWPGSQGVSRKRPRRRLPRLSIVGIQAGGRGADALGGLGDRVADRVPTRESAPFRPDRFLRTGGSLRRRTAWIVCDEPLCARLFVDDDKSLVSSDHGLERFLFMAGAERETVILSANRLVLPNRHLDELLATDIAAVALATLTEKLEELLFAIDVGFFRSLVEILNPLVHLTHDRLVSSLSVETSVHGLLRFPVTRMFYVNELRRDKFEPRSFT